MGAKISGRIPPMRTSPVADPPAAAVGPAEASSSVHGAARTVGADAATRSRSLGASHPDLAGKAGALATPAEHRQWRKLIYKSAAAFYASPGTMQVATRKTMAQIAPDALRRLENPGRAERGETASVTAAFADGLMTGVVRRAAARDGTTPERYLKPGIVQYVTAARSGAALAPQTVRAINEAQAGAAPGSRLARAAKDGSASAPAASALLREVPTTLPTHPLVPTDTADALGRFTIVRRPQPRAPAPAPDPHASAADAVARRDAYANDVQAELDRSGGVLHDALARRDAYHVELGRQGVGSALFGLGSAADDLRAGRPAAAARTVGEHVGRGVDPGLGVASMNEQRRIEKNLDPFLDARERLLQIRAEQAFERDRKMTTDGRDRFYDAFEKPGEFDAATVRVRAEADRALPSVDPTHAAFVPTTVRDTAVRLVTGIRNRHVLPDLTTDAPARADREAAI